jgi:hypothetical protein
MKYVRIFTACVSALLFAPFAFSSDEECDFSGRLEAGSSNGRVISSYGSFEWATQSSAVTHMYEEPFVPAETGDGVRARSTSLRVPICDEGIITRGSAVAGNGVGGVKISAPLRPDGASSASNNAMLITNQTGMKIEYVLKNADQFSLMPVQIAQIDFGSGQLLGISIRGEYDQVSVGAWLETPTGTRTLAFGSAAANGPITFAINWAAGQSQLSVQMFGNVTQYGNETLAVLPFNEVSSAIFGSVRPTNSLSWYRAENSHVRMTRAVWIRPPTGVPVPTLSGQSFACTTNPQNTCRLVQWERPTYTHYYQTQNSYDVNSLEWATVVLTIQRSSEFRSGTVMRVRACGSTGTCAPWSPVFAVPY